MISKVELLLLALCLGGTVAVDFLSFTDSCLLCQAAKEATKNALPLEDLRPLVRSQCSKVSEGLRGFCEGWIEEAAVSHWPMLGQTLDCELLCGSAEKKVDKAILCDKIRSITENKDAFDSSYFSTAKRFCSKQSHPRKCHSDSAAFHPIVLQALDYAAKTICAQFSCSKPVEVKAAFSNATTPMKCVLCKYLLNWIGECFVEDNKTSREMQNSIRNIVKKVCDLNKICTVFHCSCEKIAEKAIDIIKGMDVSEKACVKHDPSCSGLHLAANRVYT